MDTEGGGGDGGGVCGRRGGEKGEGRGGRVEVGLSFSCSLTLRQLGMLQLKIGKVLMSLPVPYG